MNGRFTWVRQGNALLSFVVCMALAGQAWADNFFDFPDDRRDDIAAAIALVDPTSGVVYDTSGDTSSIQVWDRRTQIYTGPLDITSTLDRIRFGY